MKITDRFSFRTLADVRNEHKGTYPGFLFLRHALAVIIILHHSKVLTRGMREGWDKTGGVVYQNLTQIVTGGDLFRPGVYALVGGFFALSGFLVAGSALRNPSVLRFLGLRVLRLSPALCAEITLSAFILGPSVTTLPISQYLTLKETYAYLLNLVGFVQYRLPGVFEQNPINDAVNANLWTLEPELGCYAILAGVMLAGIVVNRNRFATMMAIVTIAILLLLVTQVFALETRWDGTRFTRWFIIYLFFVGVLANYFEEYIPINAGLFILAAVIYFLTMLSGFSDVVAGFALVYCMLFIGTLRFKWFDRICRWDISYGLYLYGYPITMTFVYIFVVRGRLPYSPKLVGLVAVCSLIATSLFASASWLIVERPALRLKRLLVPIKVKSEGLSSPILPELKEAGP